MLNQPAGAVFRRAFSWGKIIRPAITIVSLLIAPGSDQA